MVVQAKCSVGPQAAGLFCDWQCGQASSNSGISRERSLPSHFSKHGPPDHSVLHHGIPPRQEHSAWRQFKWEAAHIYWLFYQLENIIFFICLFDVLVLCFPIFFPLFLYTQQHLFNIKYAVCFCSWNIKYIILKKKNKLLNNLVLVTFSLSNNAFWQYSNDLDCYLYVLITCSSSNSLNTSSI